MTLRLGNFSTNCIFRPPLLTEYHLFYPNDDDRSRHSAAEHRISTRILHLTIFLASVLISISFYLHPGLFNSFGLFEHRSSPCIPRLPLPRLPWGFHSRACLAMSSDGFRSVWPSHPHLRFLICKSILGYSCVSTALYSLSGPARKFAIFSLGIC